jgi:hypothetical protein
MHYIHTTITCGSSNTIAAITAVTKANSVNLEFSEAAVGDVILNQNILGTCRLSKGFICNISETD